MTLAPPFFRRYSLFTVTEGDLRGGGLGHVTLAISSGNGAVSLLQSVHVSCAPVLHLRHNLHTTSTATLGVREKNTPSS